MGLAVSESSLPLKAYTRAKSFKRSPVLVYTLYVLLEVFNRARLNWSRRVKASLNPAHFDPFFKSL